MTRPLRRISRTARQLAAGQTDRRVTVRTDDELGDLAQNFNAMADALEARLRELAAAAQRQKEFTASFAHELKTPLTSVIGYADTLRSRTLPSEMQFEAANAIYTEGKRLERMSFALLDLFALERSEPSFSRVQTGALAASVQKAANTGLPGRSRACSAMWRRRPSGANRSCCGRCCSICSITRTRHRRRGRFCSCVAGSFRRAICSA
ncbi:MAG: HAMP domain-containing protein [Oscillospiraceae bacterium]